MRSQTPHWTESSTQKFAYRIASDFVEQVREAMKAKGWSQNKFAKKLKLTPGRVSQILNNPGNLTLETMAAWARELGVKVTVTLYDDGDRGNRRGPVNAEVFRLCWERAGRPFDMWDIKRLPQVAATSDAVHPFPFHFWGFDKYRGRHAEIASNVKPETTDRTLTVDNLVRTGGEAYGRSNTVYV